MPDTTNLMPEYGEQSIDDLVARIEAAKRNINTDLVRLAYQTAKQYHGVQTRLSGEPYIIHPLAVAYLLFDLGMDTETICAGLLHDVIEDTGCTEEELIKLFGQSTTNLVRGVTKLTRMPLHSKEEQQSENVRKMLFAMSEDIRVVIIKLADRLHNMRTMEYQSGQKQREKSLETMEVYAPIAHRLGIRRIKEELEDLALRYLDPVAYHEIENMLKSKTEEREAFIIDIQKRILERLAQNQIKAHIAGRVKSIYGIYRKVYMGGKSFDEVFDIFAVRVIVDTDIDCYNVFGIIHDMFCPLPNRFKDYISTPKANGYRSLHTTVIGKEAIPFEVQIRTWEMHQTAEYGIAAHWKYKAGLQGRDKLDDTIAWVRRMIENQQESDGAEDIIKSIKTDLSADEVFAFTPKGDVKSLPKGSTVVDFAYAIHSEVGNHMIGAKINTRIVSLSTEIQTGQIVEIITTKAAGHGPNRDWLSIAKTSEARSKIRAWFKRERREENIETGRIEFERALQRSNIDVSSEKFDEYVKNVARRQHYDSMDDFYAAIGYGGLAISKFLPRIRDEYQKAQAEKQAQKAIQAGSEQLSDQLVEHQQSMQQNDKQKKSTSSVIVEGIDNCELKFARCCNPVPGDDIIGFITRGHGVSVHKADCSNMVAIKDDEEQKGRFIQVHWAQNRNKTSFFGTLDIISENRTGLLADITILLSNNRVAIERMNTHNMKNGNANIIITISIQDISQLNNIMQQLRKIKGILSVDRYGQS